MFPLLLAAWGSWRPATCLPADCFCEGIREGLVRQPANTWSSLGFLGVAVWVALRQRRAATTGGAPLARAEASLLVASLVVIGLGSAFYHASLTFVGQIVDVSGMYLMATFMLLHRLGPRWGIAPIGSVLGFVGVNAALMTAQITTPSLRRVIFGALLVTAVAIEWRASRKGRRWLGFGAGAIAIAFAIWSLDRWRILCTPESLFQGHAVWHVLGALAAACLFRHYEAEVS